MEPKTITLAAAEDQVISGDTVTVVGCKDTFAVEISSCTGVSAERLHYHLQQLWKVDAIEHEKRTMAVKNA